MSIPTESKRRRLEPPPPPNLTTSGLSICRNCNLVFRNANALNQHSKTENHKMVLDGLRPPFGAFFCLLCWVSFTKFVICHRFVEWEYADLVIRYHGYAAKLGRRAGIKELKVIFLNP